MDSWSYMESLTISFGEKFSYRNLVGPSSSMEWSDPRDEIKASSVPSFRISLTYMVLKLRPRTASVSSSPSDDEIMRGNSSRISGGHLS